MDDDLSQLEAELKGLRPAAPTRDLLARIEGELAAPTTPITPIAAKSNRRSGPPWWLWATALPAAAAIAVMIAATRGRPGTAPRMGVTPQPAVESAAEFKPVSAENLLYAAEDEGLVTLDDGTPARRERLNYVDTITWKNARTNASVRWTIPREEVRVIPVKFQ